jgi:hypothetical protein
MTIIIHGGAGNNKPRKKELAKLEEFLYDSLSED